VLKQTAPFVILALLLMACSGTPGPGPNPTEQAATAEAAIDATRQAPRTPTATKTANSPTVSAVTPDPTPESRGDQIAFWRDLDGEVDIIVLDPDTREERNLTLYPRGRAFRPAYSPDGRLLAFVSDSQENWDIYYTPADGSAFLPTNLTIWMGPDLFPQWSPDGRFVTYYSFQSGQFDIYRVNVETHVKHNLTAGTPDSSEYFPLWSPDGQRILFISDRDKNDELYVMSWDGWDVKRLTETPDAKEHDAAWTPDGTRIAYVVDEAGNQDIYLMRSDGTDIRRITSHEADDGIPTWSPDGSRMLFVSNRDGNTEIYLLDMACVDAVDGCESQAVNLTNHPADDSLPAWSPDGGRIAFVSTRDGRENIFVMLADGSNPINLTESLGEEFGPVWMPRPAGDRS